MSKSTFRASSNQQGLMENMQILTGQKGDRLDKALTLREAASLGMVNLRRNSSGQIVPELPPSHATDPEWTGVQMPHAPVNVTADGAFHTITLTWYAPTYRGHGFAEVLRAEVNNPAQAVRIGTTLANVYSDAVGKGFSAYYWVRFVNKNSMAGPLHSTAGLRASTSPDVDEIIASATNFAIYNPAKPSEKEIIFGVTDDGKVAIREAVIKTATIQIIHSEKITADYIKAGVSISAPSIVGGSFDMGNAFMSGGSAGFGLGGPYSAWGKGWNTVIYSDGSVYTNRLRAEGGYVKNMTMANCTIEQDCTIKGTLDADQIIGDVTKLIRASGAFQIAAYKRARNVVGIKPIFGSAEVSGHGTIGIALVCKLNGTEVARASVTEEFSVGVNRAPMSIGFLDAFVLPANTTGNVTFEVVGISTAAIQGQKIYGEGLWLMGLW